MNHDERAVAELLRTYERALNASDTDAILRLYAPDGVFMPQHSPSSVGPDAVRHAYDAVFTTIRLEVAFAIEEVRTIAPGWAFARTNSAGKVTVLANGAVAAEANQELFVLQKIGDDWKIARYAFSTTSSPR